MTKRAKVVVIGSSNTDMAVTTPKIPAPGETVLGDDFMMTSGGKGANQAVAASRLGAEVTLIARVGTDMFGDRTVANIAAAGVNTKYVVRDSRAASGVALIYIAEDGQNSIVVAGGANNHLSPEDIDAARPAMEDADVVTLQFETPLETVAHAIRVVKDLGKRVIVNPAPACDLPFDFLEGVDVITPNEVEAAMLLGLAPGECFDGRDSAIRLLVLGVGAAVITLGSEGAVCGTHGCVQQILGKRVIAVDTTGAGDCFTGALACALGEGQELEPAVCFANAAAALSVTRFGAQASMPNRAEVEALIQQR